MVLNHVHDVFHVAATQNPTEPTSSCWLRYLAPWLTHLRASTFMLLAGTSIFVQEESGKLCPCGASMASPVGDVRICPVRMIAFASTSSSSLP